MNNKIYVAGPYSAHTIWGRIKNILAARKVAKKICELGFYAYCPHMNTALFDDIQDYQFFIDMHLDYLKDCRVVVMVEGWQTSKGSNIEYEYAADKGMPIYFNIDAFISHEVKSG